MKTEQQNNRSFHIAVVVMLLVAVMTFHWLARQGQTVQIAYSEFKRYLADGKIGEVVIADRDHGHPPAGKRRPRTGLSHQPGG